MSGVGVGVGDTSGKSIDCPLGLFTKVKCFGSIFILFLFLFLVLFLVLCLLVLLLLLALLLLLFV